MSPKVWLLFDRQLLGQWYETVPIQRHGPSKVITQGFTANSSFKKGATNG